MLDSPSFKRGDNSPALWSGQLNWPQPDGNKYDRGHAVVLGGPVAATGAARLSARTALRGGAGLVSIACDPSALMVYAVACEAVMTKPLRDADAFAALIADPRVTGVLMGPAAGVNDRTRALVLAALEAGKACVLDADALSVFEGGPDALFGAITAPTILTPHEGEFARLFGAITDREADAVVAAQKSGAVMVLKGRDTVIAAPDGRVVINKNASEWLATAGSGDVLAGLCVSLLAQGMPAFEAACAATWMHAEAAYLFGPGLIAEDLPDQLPRVWQGLSLGHNGFNVHG
ncbi:NAD(P)H-hydrate dehydratase [Asticcacaulis machinosus]|uniref:ADP-dependent (S)-NAD(P)H-hydrate dehydratase n=1 Tax=Asticcacaulis machinosus TaxID=2984211 RepID=A0ABT5HIS5_9CAUL|nr:NAD(P)H-hydrate dehydratase [Asticcacaulis machinosus]MDC7675504.1 NAD(P)H-hydrate dehydratase [Asticcacaulis machinosus]